MNTEKVVEHIVNWLKDYATNAKVNGFVIGISGGIDSAVTSTLCAKTGFPVLCVEMPIHQGENQVSRAKEHISQLKNRFKKVRSTEVNLTATFEEFKLNVPTIEDDVVATINLQNLLSKNSTSNFKAPNNYFDTIEEITITKLKAEVIQTKEKSQLYDGYFDRLSMTVTMLV